MSAIVKLVSNSADWRSKQTALRLCMVALFCVSSMVGIAHAQSTSASARGTVNFANSAVLNGVRVIDAPVFDTDGVTKLEGGFVAQLFAGPSADSLAVAGDPIAFRTGVGAGYFIGGSRTIETVTAGATAYVQVKVWESQKGNSYDVAVAAGSKFGLSSVITVQTGGVGAPPTLPAYLIGLQSFKLSPGQLGIIPGKVNFANTITSAGQRILDAPVFDVDGTTRLSGSAFQAQLYAGLSTNTLVPVGAPTAFLTGVGAGYFSGGSRDITTVPAGLNAYVQVRVWETAKGSSFDAASNAGSKIGISSTFTVKTGGDGNPPTIPANLIGLASFGLRNNGNANLAPTISEIADQTIEVDRSLDVVFAVGDAETPLSSLTVTPTTSNAALVPASNVVITGSGANRVAKITPVRGQTGTAAITITVRDGQLSGSESFLLTVTSIDTTARGTVVFSNLAGPQSNRTVDAPIFDVDGQTRISGSSYVAQLYAGPSPNALAPVGATTRFLTGAAAGYFTPATREIPTVAAGEFAYVQVRVWETSKGTNFDQALAAGSKTGKSIPLAVKTGGAGIPPGLPADLVGLQSFALNLEQAVNTPPTISSIADQTIKENSKGVSVLFLVNDRETQLASLNVEVNSSNPTLIPRSTLRLAGTGANRVLAIVPAPGRSGSGTITVEVSDAQGLKTAKSFVVTVLPLSKQGHGDLNGDGFADLIFKDAEGYLAIWSMDGAVAVGASFLDPNNVGDDDYRIVCSADFDRNGREDMLLQKKNGALGIWSMDGITRIGATMLQPSDPGSPQWVAVGSGDFNADEREDIVFQNRNGTIALWLMDGTAAVSAQFFEPSNPGDRQWRVAGVGDINGDRKPELVFQHEDGTLAVWYTEGRNVTKSAFIEPRNPGDPNWKVAGVTDLDKNQKADLLFQNESDGNVAVWFLDDTKVTGMSYLNPANPGGTWELIVP